MAFPQATDYRPPIIPDGEVYENPENGKSYYWTQILLPEGSTPDTATSIGGYWSVMCEPSPSESPFVLKDGDTMTGRLTLSGPPTRALHAATKKYVDERWQTCVINSFEVKQSGDILIGEKDILFETPDRIAFTTSYALEEDYNIEIKGTQYTIVSVDELVEIDELIGYSYQWYTLSSDYDPDYESESSVTITICEPKEYVEKTGDVMTGQLTLAGPPVSDFDATTKEYVDTTDIQLQIQIDEIEQELDLIAPRLEGAQYKYVDSPSVKAGEMHIVSGSFTSPTDIVIFNDEALDGLTHAWGSLDVNDYLEITDTQQQSVRTSQNYAMYMVTKEPEGTGLKQIEVSLVKGAGVPTPDDVLDAKGFELGGNEINDLDDRYAAKNHTHSQYASVSHGHKGLPANNSVSMPGYGHVWHVRSNHGYNAVAPFVWGSGSTHDTNGIGQLVRDTSRLRFPYPLVNSSNFSGGGQLIMMGRADGKLYHQIAIFQIYDVGSSSSGYTDVRVVCLWNRYANTMKWTDSGMSESGGSHSSASLRFGYFNVSSSQYW